MIHTYHSFLVIFDELNHLGKCVVLGVWFRKLTEVDAVNLSCMEIVAAVISQAVASTVAAAATTIVSTATAALRKLHKSHDRALWSLIILFDLGMVLLIAASYHLDTSDCIAHRIVDEHLVVGLLIAIFCSCL